MKDWGGGRRGGKGGKGEKKVVGAQQRRQCFNSSPKTCLRRGKFGHRKRRGKKGKEKERKGNHYPISLSTIFSTAAHLKTEKGGGGRERKKDKKKKKIGLHRHI